MTAIVIAPDSFKGTASADHAAQWIAEGIREILPDANVTLAGMADGGEGTASRFPGTDITLPTTDAAGRLTEATYRWDSANSTAYIDIAAASGLPAVANSPVPLAGDTYGTGVLIADAQTRGARRIVLGLGGSATTDGGMGILVALGAVPHNKAGFALAKGGGPLVDLDNIDTAQLNVAAAGVEYVLLTDTTAPVTGPQGAAYVFAPQKGATDEQAAHLDRALTTLCEVTGIDPTTASFGAAGATPVGMTWLSRLIYGNDEHVRVLPGARLVARAMGLDELIADADLVITGEGAIDGQSGRGKVVGTIADMVADQPRATLGLIAGRFDCSTDELFSTPPSNTGLHVVTAKLGEPADVEAQLHAAGRSIAESFIRGR